MKLEAYYCLQETDFDFLPKMKALVAKAEQILSSWSLIVNKDQEELRVDVEPTHYDDHKFGIRIYLGKLGHSQTIRIKMIGVKHIDCGENWISVCFEDNTAIQFVYVNGVMPRSGKPKWNGKIADIDLNKCLIPWHATYGPCLVLMGGCGDNEPFCPIFPTPEKLHAHMEYLIRRGILTFQGYQIKQIDEANEFMDSLREQGVRLMYDPEVVDNHHTRWKEVIYSGEEWKFVDQDMN